jgi:tetratricopeptide (TPR) repeat protein
LMHRAVHLARKLQDESQRILVTTFTTNLSVTIKHHIQRLSPEVAGRIEVTNLHALARTICSRAGWKGRIAEDNNDPEDAIVNYMEVGVGPEYLAANSRIGVILVEQEQLDRSHTWFEEQRKRIPQLSEQLYGLEADILTRANATKESMKLLNQALKEMPSSTSLRYARAMLSEQLDDLESMEKDLRILLAADPDNATALNALGYTLADRTTRYAEALELVSRALALQPNEPAILDSMGWVLFRNGQYDESVVYLSRAYAEFPDAEVAAHLGEVLWAKGDTEDAIAIWQAALLRDPEHPTLLKTLRKLGVELPPAAPAEVAPTQQKP